MNTDEIIKNLQSSLNEVVSLKRSTLIIIFLAGLIIGVLL